MPELFKGRGPEVVHDHRDVAHQFADAEQQHASAELGMWLFLVTEIMFFGGLFLAYFIYRESYPIAFTMGSHYLNVRLGTINTGILLTSSLTMALAVGAAEQSQRGWLVVLLLATMVLGSVFLGIKGWEYYQKYSEHVIPFAGWTFEPAGSHRAGMMAFFNLYFLMTGLHALHMVIGLAMLALLTAWACRGEWPQSRLSLVHNVGLYWHFVDLVWVYLFPFFYLVSASVVSVPPAH